MSEDNHHPETAGGSAGKAALGGAAKGAAKGAAVGGVHGAVVGAAKGAATGFLKSGAGKTLVAAGAALAVIAPMALMSLLGGGAVPTALSDYQAAAQAQSTSTVLYGEDGQECDPDSAADECMDHNPVMIRTGEASGTGETRPVTQDDLQRLVSLTRDTGVAWQVVLSLAVDAQSDIYTDYAGRVAVGTEPGACLVGDLQALDIGEVEQNTQSTAECGFAEAYVNWWVDRDIKIDMSWIGEADRPANPKSDHPNGLATDGMTAHTQTYWEWVCVTEEVGADGEPVHVTTNRGRVDLIFEDDEFTHVPADDEWGECSRQQHGPTSYDYDTEQARQLGEFLANFYVQNIDALAINYIIWDAQIYSANNQRGWVTYRHPAGATDDTSMHLDHVHVSVFRHEADGGEGDPTIGGGTGGVSPLDRGWGKYDLIDPSSPVERGIDAHGQESGSNPLASDQEIYGGPNVYAIASHMEDYDFSYTREQAEDDEYADAMMVGWLRDHLSRASTGPDGLNLSTGVIGLVDTGERVVISEDEVIGSSRGTTLPQYYDSANYNAAQRVRETYVEVISRLPIVDMNRMRAEVVYDRALTWYLGKEYVNEGHGGKCILSPTGSGLSPEEVGTLQAQLDDGSTVVFEENQLANAATIIGVGMELGVTNDGLKVALMTALQESHLLMYANDTVPNSKQYPHDAVGSDHDSLGLFQQRPISGWGEVEQLMDATYNAQAFYGGPTGPNNGSPRGMLDIDDWQDRAATDPGGLAQAVQVSAHPEAYDKWEPVAERLLAELEGVSCASGMGNVSATGWTLPVVSHDVDPARGQFMTSKFGYRGNIGVPGASAFHYGIDFSGGGALGKPIFAAADGVVVYAGGPTPWHSGHVIIIDHGSGLYSEYNHMYAHGVHVRAGQRVHGGEHIADIGNDGNSSGPHLHFSIIITDGDPLRPGGENFVDPVCILRDNGIDVPGSSPISCNPPQRGQPL